MTGSIRVRAGTRSCSSARCARCGTTTPRPPLGVEAVAGGIGQGEELEDGGDQLLLEAVADLALGFVVDDDDERVLRGEDGGDEGVGDGAGLDQVAALGVVGDAVLGVDLAPQELGHVGVEAEALREFDHRWREGEEGGEEGLVGAELLEGAARLAGPVVLDDRRHLAVVADDDEAAVGRQGEGGHDRFRQVHLRGLVEDQAVGEVVAEEIFGPAVLDQTVDAAGGGRDHAPARGLDRLDGLGCARIALAVFGEGDDAGGDGAARAEAEEGDVEQAGIEVGGEELGVGGGPAAQQLLDFHHVVEEDVGGRVGLAGEEGAEPLIGGHGALEAGEEGEGGGVALAGAGRTLDEEERGAAVAGDELALARFEAMERAGGVEGVETGHEARLTLRSGLGPEGERPLLAGEDGIEGVLAAGDQARGDLRGPRAVDVVRIRVEGVGLAWLQGLLVDGAEGEPRRSGAAPHEPIITTSAMASTARSPIALDRDAVQLGAHAVEHLLGGRGELDLLGDRQAAVGGQAGVDDEPLVRLEGGETEDLVEVAGDVGGLQAEPEAHPLLRPV